MSNSEAVTVQTVRRSVRLAKKRCIRRRQLAGSAHSSEGVIGGSSETAGEDAEASRTARHEVLGTVELLEEILIHLPTKDLLFAQAVCSTWKNCIGGSPRLQQGLFFQIPKGTPPIDVTDAILYQFPLKDLINHQFRPELINSVRNITINPLLREKFNAEVLGEYYMKEPRSKPRQIIALQRPEASFRRMHFSYPEVSRVRADAIAEFMLDNLSPGAPAYGLFAEERENQKKILRPTILWYASRLVPEMQTFETTSQLQSHYAKLASVEEDACDGNGQGEGQ